jgi:hypothetical protein
VAAVAKSQSQSLKLLLSVIHSVRQRWDLFSSIPQVGGC